MCVHRTCSGTLAYEIEEIPEKDDVIAHFRSNYLSCLASGCVDQMFKFYFFAEMVRFGFLLSLCSGILTH